jgi:uncharacterized membrane protein
MMQFLKTTVIGGIVFLVPVVIFVFIIGKALVFTRKITAPFAGILPFGPVGDAVVVNLLGLALIVLVCFLGGLVAKSAAVARLVDSLENNFLSKIPIYALIKSTVSGTVQSEEAEGMKSVLVRLDDSWQLGFEIERLSDGKVTVFLPGAPDPWSGSVCFVSEDRITKLDANLLSITKVLKGFGKGSGNELKMN